MRTFTAFCFASLLSFPALASISGTVMNADGQAIAGAKVSLFAPETIDARRARWASATPEWKPLITVTADNGGGYKIDSPKGEPAVIVAISANGYAPSETWVLADEEVGATVLTQAPLKTGTVTANGKPVPNATVVWQGDGEFVGVTDANGHYSVPDPGKWALRAMVFHPDFARFEENTIGDRLRGRRRAGANGGGAIVEGVSPDLALTAGVPLKGRVIAGDGTTPAADAQVFIDSWPAGKTAADGTFTIAHARKDWQTVEAHSGNLVAARAHSEKELVLKLTKGASVAGRLIDGKTKLPIAATPVTLVSAGMTAQAQHSAISDAKGNFSIAPLIAGNYTLQISRPGYGFTPPALPLTASQSFNKSLLGTPHARVSGTVTDEDHRPVAAAHVASRNAVREGMATMMIGRPGMARSVWSGPDGRYVLRDTVDAPSVVVEATKKGFPSAASSAMKLAEGENKTGVNLTIPRGIAFSGRVLDKNGKPVSGASIDASEAARDGMPNMRRMMVTLGAARGDDLVRTASDGTFSIRLREGTYDVSVKREAFATKVLRGQTVNATTKPVEVVLDPGVEISGRVTRGGAGVEGVNVTALSQDGLASAMTMPDGSFKITDLTPGQMMLNAMKFDAFIMENRMVSAPADNVNIELPAGGKVIGHVVDKATHNAVTSFQAGVTTSRSGGGMTVMLPPMLKQFTSDDGAFELDNIRPGPTQIVVNAPGYTTGRLSNVDVEDGKSTADLEIDLETGVRLAGRITDANGAPIAGASVRADNTSGGGRVMRFDPNGTSSVATDSNGEYAIEGQEPGEKSFNFSRTGFVSEDRTVNLTGKEVRLDVQLGSGMHLAGIVTTDAGAPVPDALVRANSASDSTFGREARTDANGGFTLEGVAPGHYTFTASKSGFANGIARDVDVSVVNPVRITMTSGGTLSGHVTGLTQDELQNATVIVASSGSGQVTGPIDSSGAFQITGAPTGTLRVSARSGNMFGASMKQSEPKTVVLDPGGSAQVDIDFKSQTVIRGRVTRNGAPLNNAIVTFFATGGRSQGGGSTHTDGNGAYQIDSIDDGPYNVTVIDFDRLSPYSETYTVSGSATHDIDIRTVTLRGTVVDATSGEPINEARVEMRGTGGDTSMFNGRSQTTDTNGVFTIDNVPKGSFQITADKEGYGNDTRVLVVGDSAPDMAPFKLAAGDGITLTVVDGRDGRQLSAAAHAIDSQGRTFDAGAAGPFGGGSPAPVKLAVSPGAYTITVMAPGYAPRTLTSVPAPSRQSVSMTPGGTLLIRSKSNVPLRGRLLDANGLIYNRTAFSNGSFPIVSSPGTTTQQFVAAGSYTLQVLDTNDQVLRSVPVTVNEGQPVTVDL